MTETAAILSDEHMRKQHEAVVPPPDMTAAEVFAAFTAGDVRVTHTTGFRRCKGAVADVDLWTVLVTTPASRCFVKSDTTIRKAFEAVRQEILQTVNDAQANASVLGGGG